MKKVTKRHARRRIQLFAWFGCTVWGACEAACGCGQFVCLHDGHTQSKSSGMKKSRRAARNQRSGLMGQDPCTLFHICVVVSITSLKNRTRSPRFSVSVFEVGMFMIRGGYRGLTTAGSTATHSSMIARG